MRKGYNKLVKHKENWTHGKKHDRLHDRETYIVITSITVEVRCPQICCDITVRCLKNTLFAEGENKSGSKGSNERGKLEISVS